MTSAAATLPSFASCLAKPKPHERRFAVALLGSGALHAAIGIALAVSIALGPPAAAPANAPVLQAVLEQPTALPVLAELAPLPAAVVTPILPAPQLAVAAVPAAPTLPRAALNVARPPMIATDPNGRVAVAVLHAADVLGSSVASRLAQRYPRAPDKPPRMLGSVAVTYPAEARHARESMRIAAVVDVDEQGRIAGMRLVPEHPWFGPAVSDALRDARFEPAELAARPVAYWTIVDFAFGIASEGGAQHTAASARSQPISGM